LAFIDNQLYWLDKQPEGNLMRPVTIFAICAITTLFSISATAENQIDSALEQQAVELLQQYVRQNTVNPPGNEIEGARFIAEIFDQAGVEYEIVEAAPGRANIWAKIEGGDKPGLLLLSHMDVVPASPEFWSVDPLGGEIIDGYLYGRGVIDDKASGIAHLLTFLELHKSGQTLNRDLVFMATADEEAGGFFGAGWLTENRPELFEGIGLVINEGGVGIIDGEGDDKQFRFNVEVTQKVPLWLKLVSVDLPGHGSMPRTTSSLTRLVRALSNILDHPFEPQIVPSVDAYFKAVADKQEGTYKTVFADIETAAKDEGFMRRFQEQNPGMHALTRNTCSLTMLEGSNKINVVPPQAVAQLDCRLVPSQDPDEFTRQLSGIIDDEAIQIERIMGFSPAVSSTDTELFEVIESLTAEYHPQAAVVPSVVGGFTDSHFLRDMGITAYGYHPILLPDSELERIHGNDERLSLENIRQGTRMIYNVVSELVLN